MLATTIAVGASTPVTAQGTPATAPASRSEIRGHVVNAASKTAITAASVDVTLIGASASAGRASTAADGAFRVQGLRPGRYRVQVRALGYKPFEIASVDLRTASADVGTVALVAAPLQLQSVAVTEKRQEVQLAPDKNSYVVRDMPATKGGSALDVLKNVPAVDVDIDNVVSLRGNSGVTVQINGRPSPMKAAQLGDYLGQLSADLVDKVEVIPNPSARDDPTGVAGIINIILKQEPDAGTSGGLTLSGSTTGHVDVGANVAWQRGPLTFFGSYGFFRDDRPRTETLFRQNLYLEPITYLEEAVDRTQFQNGHTLTGSTGYRLGQHDDLSLDVLFTSRNESESNGIVYRDENAARTVTGLSDRLTTGTNHRFNLESTLGYKHAFATKGHKLSSEFRFSGNKESGPLGVVARTLALDGTPVGPSILEDQAALEHPNEKDMKVDYVRPLSSRVRLETGYKGSWQQFHTTQDTRVLDNALAVYMPDSTRISNFTYDQVVNAAYGMLSAQTGPLQLQGGVRVERATTQFHLNTSNATYDNDYNSIFPSALVAYNVDDAHQVKLSYSTRIRRPDDTDVLDPTLHFQDPLNTSRGNPYLRPEYIRSFELGLQRTADRMTIQLTPFWRHTIDAVRSLRSIDSLGVATRTYANVSTSDSYGGDANVAISGGRLSGFAGASAYRQVSDASNVSPDLSLKTFGWRARANAAFRASSSLDIQTLLSYQAAMNVEQGRNASRTQFSMAARQKLVEDRLSLTLRVIDPFNTSREINTTFDPRFYQVSDRRRAIRGLLVSANWTFGKPEKKGRDTIDLGGDGGPP
jgi:outer membrane receptor for ferrienterochelin and colicin